MTRQTALRRGACQDISAGYRRWAGVLLWLAIALAGVMVVAALASIAFLVKADTDVDAAAYGYLALFLWFGIAAATPVLLALGIPAIIMRRRVRQQARLERGLLGQTHSTSTGTYW